MSANSAAPAMMPMSIQPNGPNDRRRWETVVTTSVQPPMTPRRSFMSHRIATTQRPSSGPPIHHGSCE